MFRIISTLERKKRGCQFCNDVGTEAGPGRLTCKFKSCPYKVLDKYETYDEYLKSEDSKILVDQFFSSAAECYHVGRITKKPQRMFSDGDKRTAF